MTSQLSENLQPVTVIVRGCYIGLLLSKRPLWRRSAMLRVCREKKA